MSGSKKMKVDDLAEAIQLFVTHLLDGATDLHVVLGPILWRPSPDDPGDKLWYFIAAVCGADGFRCDRLDTNDPDLTEQARSLAMLALVDHRPRVVHDMGDELAMAKLCEVLWPGPRISALRAAIEGEYAAS
jgi:hypothetical protein